MKTKLNKTTHTTDYINSANGKCNHGHAWYSDFTLNNGNDVSVWFPKSWTKKSVQKWIWEMYGVEAA